MGTSVLKKFTKTHFLILKILIRKFGFRNAPFFQKYGTENSMAAVLTIKIVILKLLGLDKSELKQLESQWRENLKL